MAGGHDPDSSSGVVCALPTTKLPRSSTMNVSVIVPPASIARTRGFRARSGTLPDALRHSRGWRVQNGGMPARVATLAVLALAALPSAAAAAEPTGRWLVEFERGSTARSSWALGAVMARTGVERAGRGVPALGIATVDGPAAGIARLRRDPAVASVSAEWRRDFRRVPNDPGLLVQQPDAPPGTPIQWWLGRSGFPTAWDVTTGSGSIVGIIDSGIDGGHPQLAPKIAAAEQYGGAGGATSDQDGHGTHVSGLACAATDDGGSVAGAGWDCRIVLMKTPLLRDEDIINGIFRAVELGADAINMSFGGGEPTAALQSAIDFAFQRNVVLVAAASNDPVTDQGSPASQLQPGDAPQIESGLGLVVTAVDFSDLQAGTGRGPQISMAAYGFFDGAAPFNGPPGLLSTFPSSTTGEVPPFVVCPCRTDFQGDTRYAYLEGTSMAAPQVTATAAMVGELNPFLSAPEKIRLIKETARRSGGWREDVGWGILDAGRAVDAARRIDKSAPASHAEARQRVRTRTRRRVRLRVRLEGTDSPGAPGLLPSGIASFDLFQRRGQGGFRRVRQGVRGSSVLLRLRPGVYRFFTRAIDAAGNHEGAPNGADVRVAVRRG
jgi:subtilisin family serine protease